MDVPLGVPNSEVPGVRAPLPFRNFSLQAIPCDNCQLLTYAKTFLELPVKIPKKKPVLAHNGLKWLDFMPGLPHKLPYS
jgi:hypothetical protein